MNNTDALERVDALLVEVRRLRKIQWCHAWACGRHPDAPPPPDAPQQKSPGGYPGLRLSKPEIS